MHGPRCVLGLVVLRAEHAAFHVRVDSVVHGHRGTHLRRDREVPDAVAEQQRGRAADRCRGSSAWILVGAVLEFGTEHEGHVPGAAVGGTVLENVSLPHRHPLVELVATDEAQDLRHDVRHVQRLPHGEAQPRQQILLHLVPHVRTRGTGTTTRTVQRSSRFPAGRADAPCP